MIATPMTEQRDAMVALGWTVISDYGYTHPSGWTIGIYRLQGACHTELWDGRRRHAEFDTPLNAAAWHRELISDARDAGQPMEEPCDAFA